MKVIAVIPARLASTRLPEKPLALITSKTMIEQVYSRVVHAKGIDRVIVATDHEKIATEVRRFGGEVMMTSPDLNSGTDRVAAVADQIPGSDQDIFVNVQGDEPLMDPRAIEAAVDLVRSRKFPMGTVMTPLTSREELSNFACVKVIADRMDRAIYFSRHSIPYTRGEIPKEGSPMVCRKHVGLYTYTRQILMRIRALPPSPIEKAEVLEQLRALEDGIAIGVKEVNFVSLSVDTAEDLARVREYFRTHQLP